MALSISPQIQPQLYLFFLFSVLPFFTTYFKCYSHHFPYYTLDCAILFFFLYIFFKGEIVHNSTLVVIILLKQWHITNGILPISLLLCFQDLACIDDLSTNSLFSSPADSLSEYADSQSFINTDNLDTVPTLWDINTNTTNAPAQNQSEVGLTPLHIPLFISCLIPSLPFSTVK